MTQLVMTQALELIPLNYCTDTAFWFRFVRDLPQPIWLDSGYPQSSYGRFDIVCADPVIRFETYGSETRIVRDQQVEVSTANPFELINAALAQNILPRADTPFCGGAVGYFGYDLGRHLERLPEIALQDIALPDMCIGIYAWAIVQDHSDKKAWLVLNHDLAAPGSSLDTIRKRLLDYAAQFDQNQANKKSEQTPARFALTPFVSNLDSAQYHAAIAAVKHYIYAGDCYQVNIAQRFSADYSGDCFSAYLALRAALPSPFSAYMELSRGAILSLSPERFIALKNGNAETKPIKGTIARGANPIADKIHAEQLLASQKDRAENVMIVDLLRNDFSKTCDVVAVPELFALQSFANVHHLVSTVTGKLRGDKSATDLLASCFPGGSITGAPKIRAMEIIEELEPVRRSVYCGSIGYISCCGTMDTNIAIRTLVCDQGRIHCWGGGGIVADSQADKEYEETFAKVSLLLRTLEQFFLVDDLP